MDSDRNNTTSSRVVYRISNKGLDDGGRFLSEKKDASSQPLFHHVQQSDNTAASLENVATLHYCFKPFWVAMRIQGMFPIHRTQTGTAEFKMASSAFNYSVVAFVLVGMFTATVTLYRISFLRNADGSFSALIFSYMCLIYCIAYWFLPIGHWFAAKKMALYVNNWSKFQAHTHKLTGVPISFKMRCQILFWTFAIPVMCALHTAFEFAMLQAFDYWEVIYYLFINILVQYHHATWCYMCSALSRAASHLELTLAGELRAHPHDQSVVPKYRELWEELSCLTRATGNVLCYVYGSIKIMSFTILTCSIYGSLCDGGLDYVSSKQIGLGVNAIIVFGGIVFVCNSAHLATKNIGEGFLCHLKQLKSQVVEIQWQLEQFQKAVCLDPPSISLGGYVVINRELLISLLATIVTYLVVLLQFKAGESKEPNGSLVGNGSLTTFSP